LSESPVRQNALFSFDFNRSVKVRKESPDITSNAGILLLREAEYRLGIVDAVANDISSFNAAYGLIFR
jgi:hypothetical protein